MRRSHHVSLLTDCPAGSLYAAPRAETIGVASFDAAQSMLFGYAYAAAILARARGDLAAAIGGFDECGAAFQAARTRLLPNADDAAAHEVVARLEASPGGS
jgi:hypothetical protein